MAKRAGTPLPPTVERIPTGAGIPTRTVAALLVASVVVSVAVTIGTVGSWLPYVARTEAVPAAAGAASTGSAATGGQGSAASTALAETVQYAPNYSLPWVQELESGISASLSDAERYPTVAELKMLWQTPLMHVNIAALVGPRDVAKFNARIAAAVLTEFGNLLKANPTKLTKSGVTVNDANQVFFEWQKNGGWNALRATMEVRMLEDFMQTAADRFLRAINIPQEIIDERRRDLEIWATVHDRCVRHLAHCHPDSVLSGVYYVKGDGSELGGRQMPDDAGSIIFDDPRGPLPPFDNKLTIRPLAGDLVLFPSWLMHQGHGDMAQVAPTPGNDERISVAFNVPGSWTTTVGLSEFFPLPE